MMEVDNDDEFSSVACHLSSSSKRSKQAAEGQRDGDTTHTEQIQRNGVFVVDSLQTICIRFVATNIEIVESLVNFPDIMGQQIFAFVQKTDRLKDWSDDTGRILQLFTDSYQDLVLSELNLSAFPRLLLEDTMSLLPQFVHLHRLDVSDQQLGDDHQLWKCLGEMLNLSHLSMKNNLLSNIGLQHLTLPCRMFKRGLNKLQVLNLACNRAITDSGVRFLTCFSRLHCLDLSGTKVKSMGIKQIEEKLSLRLCAMDNEEEEVFILREHKGWAADVIRGWVRLYNAGQEQESMDNDSGSLLSTKQFYKKNCKQHMARSLKKLFPRVPCPSAEPLLRMKRRVPVNTGIPGTVRRTKNSPSKCALDLSSYSDVKEMREWEQCYITKKTKRGSFLQDTNCGESGTSGSMIANQVTNDRLQSGEQLGLKQMDMCSGTKTNSFLCRESNDNKTVDDSDREMLSIYQKNASLLSAMNSNQW